MVTIAAGIVLFNPDIIRLKENIDAIYEQVDLLILIDNYSNNISMVEDIYRNYKNIYIIKNKSNLGIAKGLNQIVDFCESKNFEWVLTLDQDSVCPSNLIEEYRKYLHVPDVAILSPIITDRNKSNEEINYQDEYEVIDKCITSASLTNIKICKKIGCFDETMFIDLVDFEYCKRILLNGYKIIKVNRVVLLHEIGHITQRRFLFWTVDVKNHSAFRKYYMARNLLYCAKKHGNNASIGIAYLRILKILAITVLYEFDKKNKTNAILKGVKDGRKTFI